MRLPSALLLFPLLSLALVAACSNQAEGERCDTRNGNNDCQSGLTCQARPTVGYACCPPDLTQATTAACGGSSANFDASAAVPDGSGTEAASSGDAGGDGNVPDGAASTPDGTASAFDAAADAPADGPIDVATGTDATDAARE